jgi:putative NADH-flavin reductase
LRTPAFRKRLTCSFLILRHRADEDADRRRQHLRTTASTRRSASSSNSGIRSGARYAPDQIVSDLVEADRFAFRNVHPSQHIIRLGYAMPYYRRLGNPSLLCKRRRGFCDDGQMAHARRGPTISKWVTAVMREGASASVPQGVDVIRGDPLDAAFVDRVVTGKDAVVTALGVHYRRGRNPFSSIVSPTTLLSRSAAHMLAAMKRHGVSRISMVSAAGVGDSHKSVAWPLRVFFRISNIHVDYEDIERAEALLAASGLDWQAVRRTTLTDGARTGTRRVDRYATTMRTAREDVARFMLDQLEQPRFDGRTPMISSAVNWSQLTRAWTSRRASYSSQNLFAIVRGSSVALPESRGEPLMTPATRTSAT